MTMFSFLKCNNTSPETERTEILHPETAAVFNGDGFYPTTQLTLLQYY